MNDSVHMCGSYRASVSVLHEAHGKPRNDPAAARPPHGRRFSRDFRRIDAIMSSFYDRNAR